jgi:trk system potassium uptake protein TrkA
MKVCVCGAGKVGLFIANDLALSGHDVLLIEKEDSVLAKLQKEPGVNAVLADACELRSLQRLNLDTYDVLVAATGDDEDNLVASLLAKQEFAVPRIVARVNHPENERLFNESWGVDISVSTPHLLSGLVEEATMTGQLVRLLKLGGGEVNLLEYTLTSDSAFTGQAVSDIDLPHGVNLVAVLRSGSVVVPRGETTLFEGDEVIAVVTQDAEAQYRQLLAGEPVA